MNTFEAFSSDYETARSRFLAAAKSNNFQILSYPIQTTARDDLTIDLTIHRGNSSEKIIMISSGLHGIEGFLGSAIQFALLDSALNPNISFIFIHALNPYGFKYLRRTNEDNIDLNRNFLLLTSQLKISLLGCGGCATTKGLCPLTPFKLCIFLWWEGSKVVEALRDENRDFWYSQSKDFRIKDRIKEVFTPANKTWRVKCVLQGLEIISMAINSP